MVMVNRAVAAVLLVALVPVTVTTQASLAQVPGSVAGDLRRELLANRARVETAIDNFNARATDFNTRCQGLPATHPSAAACQRELAGLSKEALNIERDKSVFNASVASAALVNSDAMVVDTRDVKVAGSELVAQIPQLRGSAGATAMAKGFEALIHRDWTSPAWWLAHRTGAPPVEPGDRRRRGLCVMDVVGRTPPTGRC